MALMQQEMQQRKSQEQRASEKWGIEKPELEQKPFQESFEYADEVEPDWMGTGGGVTLAKKIGLPMPSPIDLQVQG